MCISHYIDITGAARPQTKIFHLLQNMTMRCSDAPRANQGLFSLLAQYDLQWLKLIQIHCFQTHHVQTFEESELSSNLNIPEVLIHIHRC